MSTPSTPQVTNVLLVDDSPTVRNIVKIYLMNLKVSTVEADDATRALQILRLVPVSLVIADINMPGMDRSSSIAAGCSRPTFSRASRPLLAVWMV